nr:tigger transposable element-derived protein 1-like [Cherax quadricarinatus]XP_053634986.1 tigger transposable element-derived protein 1-like [Cherax quadricarinatus]XP_053634987.1 tigger transposable element-derived protein 1-like [Cherax quadricarinatus]XP_053634988.1 tigger transposable element-derived protein 1-like [Cherax quadricarinatus]
MGRKKAPSANPLIKRVRNTIEFKKDIIAKYESGMRVAELARLYGKPHTTISSIVAKKKEIKEAVVAKGVNMLTKMRSQILEDVERLLLVWINAKQLAGDSLMQSIICEKARQLHDDLVKKMPAMSAEVSEFKASKGWFERFKKRSGIHSVVRHGEAARSDKHAAEKSVQEFKGYLETEEFQPQQVFSYETGLFWKKMPKRTYITQEEKALPGHKPMKDRFTLSGFGAGSEDPMPVVESIVALGNSTGLDASGKDVEELVEEDNEELTIEELQELHPEHQQTIAQEIASEEEEERWKKVPSSEIKEICAMWSRIERFVEEHHPNKAVVSRVNNMYNDYVLSHFREILKRHQKQSSLDRYLVPQVCSDSQAGPSGIKKQRREVTPEKHLVP